MAKKKATKKKTASSQSSRKKKTAGRKATSSKRNTTTKKQMDRKKTAAKKASVSPRKKAVAKKRAKTRFKPVQYRYVRARMDRDWLNITEQRDKVKAVFAEYHDELFSHPDVCGLHVGLKRQNGRVCDPLTYCIRIHVHRKWPEGHPMLSNPIRILQGIADTGVDIDIVERSYGLVPGTSTSVAPPIPGAMIGGRPIGPKAFPDHWGTMGMVVFFGGDEHYLTNQHVVGDPNDPDGNPVSMEIQEPREGLTFSDKTGRIIGKVVKSRKDAIVDCAIVKPSGSPLPARGILKANEPRFKLLGDYATRTLTSADEHKTKVFKIGASTGFAPLLVGVVKNVDTSIKVSGTQMTEQIIVESQSNKRIIAPGDSGSIAIVKGSNDENFVVGLVHAETKDPENGETGHGMVACHFHHVQNALGISLFP